MPTSAVKVSDYVIDFLVSKGITHVFEVCGGMLAHLLDSLYDRTDISAVSMHHEMAAAIAAEGYARASENIGVAMATSGPGATNLITGIGSCFFDSIPCLFVTGQVNTYEFKFDAPTRQIGFQETDIVNIVSPITKHAELITNAKAIGDSLEYAYTLARSGRPGPVLLDLPMNIQREYVHRSSPTAHEARIESERAPNAADIDADLDHLVRVINSAHRPVIIAGGGIRLSGAWNDLRDFVLKTEIPVVTSLMGLDAFPHDHALFIGMIGTYGNRYANLAVANADVIIALGTRFDTRQTGTKPETFARSAQIIHVDIDPAELNSKVKTAYPVNADTATFLRHLNQHDFSEVRMHIKAWRERIRLYKTQYPSFFTPTSETIEPNYFMNALSRVAPEDAIVCVDVGQIQMWTGQSFDVKHGQRVLTEGGMASMGSSLPMAIGASFAKPDSIVIAITGDGGFQLNIQELQTVYHHRLPVKTVLLNNQCYGMVRQFQQQYFGGRYQSTVIGYSAPNFVDVARAYRIKALSISRNAEIPSALSALFSDSEPMFLEVAIDQNALVLPKLSVSMPIECQDPQLPREELEKNMLIATFSDTKEDEN
jgi:acetolactate synthase-1/2/3 large subunit